jgi:hypothetical protein
VGCGDLCGAEVLLRVAPLILNTKPKSTVEALHDSIR